MSDRQATPMSNAELEMAIGYMLDDEPPATLPGCYERIRNMQAVIRQLRDAALAAPTREPAATPRDEQDAKRYRWLREQSHPWGRDKWYSLGTLDTAIDAALAEPKR